MYLQEHQRISKNPSDTNKKNVETDRSYSNESDFNARPNLCFIAKFTNRVGTAIHKKSKRKRKEKNRKEKEA